MGTIALLYPGDLTIGIWYFSSDLISGTIVRDPKRFRLLRESGIG
jgi:hypothetical protein